jgi:hypothetical protein
LRTEQEIKKQITGVRDRVKELSGFYIGEGAAMLYALEWVLGKRDTAPSGELGRAGGESGQIAVNLTKLAEKAAAEASKTVAKLKAVKPAETKPAATKKAAPNTARPSEKEPASRPRRLK